MIREDGVINIKYPVNSSLTIHKDETKIITTDKDSNNNVKYTFEHDDFATIIVYYSPYKIFENNHFQKNK